ncbi:MAG TPA: DUF2232 domain-containing protein [Ktedonobacterales bacterium]|nr:DUF2232 domain-containing protein [Ktedonobacterales bacterium]
MADVEQRASPQPAEASAQPLSRPASAWVDALTLAEGGLLADVAVILELVRIFLPIAGEAFSLLVPVPFVLLMLRRGLKATLLAVVVGALLIALMTGPHYGWRMGVSGLVGLALGFAMRARLRPAFVVFAGSLITSLVLYAFFWASVWLTAVPLSSLVAGGVNTIHAANSAAEFVLNHLGLGGLWQQSSPALAALEGWVIAYWPLVLYGVLLCGSIGAVVIYYLTANGLMRLFGYDVRPFPSPRVQRFARKLLRLAGWLGSRLRLGRRGHLETA